MTKRNGTQPGHCGVPEKLKALEEAPRRGSRIAQSRMVAPVPRPHGTVLVDVSRGWRITLDSFGSQVWELLATQPTLPVLIERLRADGPHAERLVDDLVGLLVRWREMGVIAWR